VPVNSSRFEMLVIFIFIEDMPYDVSVARCYWWCCWCRILALGILLEYTAIDRALCNKLLTLSTGIIFSHSKNYSNVDVVFEFVWCDSSASGHVPIKSISLIPAYGWILNVPSRATFSHRTLSARVTAYPIYERSLRALARVMPLEPQGRRRGVEPGMFEVSLSP
jgi:hypothetical protein